MARNTAFWRSLLSTALVVLLAAILVAAWTLAAIPDAVPPHTPWVKIGLGAACVALGASAALAWLQSLRTRRLREGITAAARVISGSEPSDAFNGRNAPELSPLAQALSDAQRRFVTEAGQADRQSRVFASLLPQLREGVIVADAAGNVVLINPAAIALLQLAASPDPARYVGMALERCIPHLDVQQLLLPDRTITGSPRIAAREIESEIQIHVGYPGGERSLLAHGSEIVLPTPRGSGAAELRGRMVVLTDVTELNRAIQVRTDFVANASHELRTPVSTIRAAVETLQGLNLSTDHEMARRFVDIVDRQSVRLEALAQDLLDLGRVESSARQFQPQPVNLRDMLADLSAQFEGRAAGKQVQWSAAVDPGVPAELSTSPQLLRLILDNLADNAMKFVDIGGTVSLRARRNGAAVEIEVADNGCGIPAEDQQRVFERFYQVDRGRSGPQRGSGLGLAIVRNAVEALRGTVHLESRPGAGTRVSVSIPVTRA